MPLTPGTRLGPYEIVAAIGAGGMGEVYKARDTRLDRTVAIKILPEAFAADADRVARFQREAKTLAALNHPNIAQIFGLEQAGDVHALAMEFVAGEDLSERIARGAIPIDEAVPIAKQVAEALEAAHEQGIIHRDLKPANIKVTADGRVKVLDFGLAKAMDPTGSASSSASMSPTITTPVMTQVGMILGTAAYMSPEQARGKPVDRRADIWAFGCVVFEMLAGRQAFDAGETVSDAIAAILRTDPHWSRLPSDTPAHIRKLLRRCLQKDPQKRLPHIGVARMEIDEAASDPTPAFMTQPAAINVAPRPIWKRAAPVVVASTLVGLLAATAGWTLRPVSTPASVTRFPIVIPEGQALTTNTRHMLAISPDGTQIAYVANNRLYLRTMSELEARPITGSDIAGALYDPAFSPDGRSIAFWTGVDQTIRRIAITGGAAVTVCQAAVTYGISWSDDAILFGEGPQGILRVPSAGGKPETIVRVSNGQLADGPQVLPDGQTLLFSIAPGLSQWDRAQIVAQSLKTGERTILIEGGSDVRYLSTGHLVYALGGVVFAVPFDARRLKVTGGPVPVVEGVRRSLGGPTSAAQFVTSATGSLVYVPGPVATASSQLHLALFDRTSGASTPLKLPPSPFNNPRASPDGKQITYSTDEGKEAIVWVYDLSGATAARRLAFTGKNRYPIWSADSERVAFQSDREGDLGIWWQRADGTGTATRLTKAGQGASHVPESWQPKRDLFLYSIAKGTVTLWSYSVKDGKSAPVGNVHSGNPINAVFSPDGRWVAYTSDESAPSPALYVLRFPPVGTPYRVSQGQGLQPLWSPDGKEIFFNPAPGQFLKAGISTSPTLAFTNPVPVPRPFATGGPQVIRSYDMTPDGKILAISNPDIGLVTSGSGVQLQVVLSWFDELKARVPTK